MPFRHFAALHGNCQTPVQGWNTIKLVDGPKLAHVLAENGIGVKNTTIPVPRLDTEALRQQLEAEQG